MSLVFWMGGAKSTATTKLIEHVLDEAAKNPSVNYLVVVPEQFGLSMQKKFIKLSPTHGIFNIDILSFARLAHRIVDEVGSSAKSNNLIINDMGKNLILRRLCKEYKDDLPIFSSSLGRLGYVSEIKSLISEFMQYRISVADVDKMAENAKADNRGYLSAKLNDAAFVYSKFLDYIHERYDTNEELLDRVSELIYKSKTVKNSVIVFEGFTGFTPVQLNLMKTLLEYSNEVHVSLVMDPGEVMTQKKGDETITSVGTPDISELFYLAKKTVITLEKIAGEVRCPVSLYRMFEDIEYSNDEIEFIASHIFKNGVDIRSKFPIGDSVHILAAANPYDEIDMIALKIRELNRKEGYRYREIAVVTTDIDDYRNIFERCFKQRNIPYFVDKTKPVLMNPFTEFIRALLMIETDNYSYESVFRFLKTYVCDIEREEIDRLENYVLKMGIAGRKRWHESFIEQLKDINEPDENILKIEETRKMCVDIIGVFEEEAGILRADSKATTSDYTRALKKVFDKVGIEEYLENAAKEFQEGKKEFLKIQVLADEMFNQMDALLGDEIIDIRDYRELVEAGLDTIRIGFIPEGVDYITLGDLTRSRLDDIKALFIIGANDTLIPPPATRGGIISDIEREFLMSLDEELELAPTIRQKSYMQHLYLYMMMTKPKDKLYISYSATGFDDTAIRPSYLVNMLKNLFDGLDVEYYSNSLTKSVIDEWDGFNKLLICVRKYIEEGLEDAEFEKLLNYYISKERYRKLLYDFTSNVIMAGALSGEDPISRAVASALYGKRINMSITKLEAYANCAYNYYLKYALKLKGREEFSFEAKDLGTIFHAALEDYSKKLKEKGIAWKDITDDMSETLMGESVERAVAQDKRNFLYSSARSTYMVNRIKRIMNRCANVIRSQIVAGDFLPKDVEVKFDTTRDIKNLKIELSEDEYMRLSGKIDRMDTCEHDGKVLVRIIDYKSADMNVDLMSVYEGRQLQLVVYMNAAMEQLSLEGRDSRFGGILYYHIDDPFVQEDTKALSDDELRDKIAKKLKLSGMINSDPEIISKMDADMKSYSKVINAQRLSDGTIKANNSLNDDEFNVVSEYVRHTIENMGKRMLSGDITSLLEYGENIASSDKCKYCDYKAVCLNRSNSLKGIAHKPDEAIPPNPTRDNILEMMRKSIDT